METLKKNNKCSKIVHNGIPRYSRLNLDAQQVLYCYALIHISLLAAPYILEVQYRFISFLVYIRFCYICYNRDIPTLKFTLFSTPTTHHSSRYSHGFLFKCFEITRKLISGTLSSINRSISSQVCCRCDSKKEKLCR